MMNKLQLEVIAVTTIRKIKIALDSDHNLNRTCQGKISLMLGAIWYIRRKFRAQPCVGWYN